MIPYSAAMFGSSSGSTSLNVNGCSVERRLNSLKRSSVTRHAACRCGVLRRKKATTSIGSRRSESVFNVWSETMNCFVLVVSTRRKPGGSGRFSDQWITKLINTAIARNAIRTIAVFNPYRPRRPNIAYRTASNDIAASTRSTTKPIPMTMYE